MYELCNKIENVIKGYQDEDSDIIFTYGLVTEMGLLEPIQCNTFMTLETFIYFTNSDVYNQLHRTYGIVIEGGSDYNNAEITIDVWANLSLIIRDFVATETIEIASEFSTVCCLQQIDRISHIHLPSGLHIIHQSNRLIAPKAIFKSLVDAAMIDIKAWIREYE